MKSKRYRDKRGKAQKSFFFFGSNTNDYDFLKMERTLTIDRSAGNNLPCTGWTNLMLSDWHLAHLIADSSRRAHLIAHFNVGKCT